MQFATPGHTTILQRAWDIQLKPMAVALLITCSSMTLTPINVDATGVTITEHYLSALWRWEANLHRLDVVTPDDVDFERDGRHLGSISLARSTMSR